MKRKVTKRNPMARALAQPQYRKKTVASKKLYSRKKVKAPKEPLTFFSDCCIMTFITYGDYPSASWSLRTQASKA